MDIVHLWEEVTGRPVINLGDEHRFPCSPGGNVLGTEPEGSRAGMRADPDHRLSRQGQDFYLSLYLNSTGFSKHPWVTWLRRTTLREEGLFAEKTTSLWPHCASWQDQVEIGCGIVESFDPGPHGSVRGQ